MSVNKCIFIGRLVRDPEARNTRNGDSVVNFSIACNEKFKDRESVEYVNIVAFGKLGDICAKYLKKGSMVYVEGRMQTSKYTDKSGVERYRTDIIANQMQMLGGKEQKQSDGFYNDSLSDVPW